MFCYSFLLAQIVAKVETRQALVNFEVRAFWILKIWRGASFVEYSPCFVVQQVPVDFSNRDACTPIRTQSHAPMQSILESASAIIISRGVLGLDVAPEKMALVQKALVAGCNMCGKPVIITVNWVKQ